MTTFYKKSLYKPNFKKKITRKVATNNNMLLNNKKRTSIDKPHIRHSLQVKWVSFGGVIPENEMIST